MTVPTSTDNDWRPSSLLGRDALLRALGTRMHNEPRIVIGVDPSLQCHTGVGRTRLVNELVHSVADQYTRVVKLSGTSPVAWHSSLRQAAQQLQVRQTHFRRAADLTAAVRDWLCRHENWLLVVDSVADLDDLKEITTGTHSGHIIAVFSDQAPLAPDGWPAPVPLGALSTEDALQVLRVACGRDWTNTEQVVAANQLVTRLERNPLCLELAGRAMWLAEIEPTQYRQLLDQNKNRSPIRLSLALLLSNIESRMPTALVLLAAGVALGPAPIPFTTLQSLADHQTSSRESLNLLIECGLLRRVSDGNFFEVVAAAVLQKRLPPTTLLRGAALASTALPPRVVRDRLSEHISGEPATEPDPWLVQRISLGQTVASATMLNDEQVAMIREAADAALDLLLPEIAQNLLLRVLDHALKSPPQGESLLTTLVELGAAYALGEQFQLARLRWRQALQFCTEGHAPHCELLLAIAEIDVNENRLDRAAGRLVHAAAICQALPPGPHQQLLAGQIEFLKAGVSLGQSNPEAAREQFRAALDLRSPLLRTDQSLLMRNRLLLARTEFMRKDYSSSERLLIDEVTIREQSSRVSESELGAACNFLAEQYYLSGRFSDAEPAYERTMAVRRSALPRGHRLIGELANKLAVIKSARGAYKEADVLFRESLATLEHTYGAEHPEVARVLNDLAESLFSQNKVEPARRLLERALNIQERSLRANDPRLGRTRCNLAAVYVARGRFVEAVRLYELDVAERKTQKNTDQASLATALNNLAEALRSLGRFGEAETRLQQSLKIRQQMVGSDHPHVAQILNNLGYLYLQQHRYPEARECLQSALQIRETCLSPTHPHVASTLGTLAEVYFTEGEYAAARPLYSRAIEIYLAALGERHPHLASLQICCARNELRLGHVGRAELMLLRGKTTIEEVLGTDHRMSAMVLLGIAELAHSEKRYEPAFPLLERSLAIQYGTMSAQRLEIAETLRLISDNLVARGLAGEALPRIAEAIEIQQAALGHNHPEVTPDMLLMGRIHQLIGNFAEAEHALRSVLEYADSQTQAHLSDEARELLPDVLIQSQQYDEAVQLLTTQVSQLEASAQSTHLLSTLSQLAGVHYLRSAPQTAAPLMDRCVELSEQLHGPDSAETAKHLDNLAGVRFLLGQYEIAEPAIRRAIGILEQERPVRNTALIKARENYLQLLRQTNRTIEADQLAALIASSQAPVVPALLSGSHVLDDL